MLSWVPGWMAASAVACKGLHLEDLCQRSLAGVAPVRKLHCACIDQATA